MKCKRITILLVKNSYQKFIDKLKNTSSVKSNNRGNGSSTTGLVKAVEPYRDTNGKIKTSNMKFKMSKNRRAFFQPMPAEMINGERVELSKATGFNPSYH